jgi:serine/threonine protein kinase
LNDHEIAPGKVLHERYTIERLLTHGGMSILYCARDSHLPGLWVVKQMKELQGNDEDILTIREQFRREAFLLAGLSHAGLPKVTDCFAEDGKDYLVEQFIDSVDLEELLSRRKRLSQYEVLNVTSRLLDVLGYLHGKGIIYRDLKPGNIMIDSAGNVHLVDFGIARFYSMGKKADTVVVGTPGFASPEHYGRGQTDARSDIYSLGATMHNLLTGRDPADTPFSFQPPSSLVPGISRGLSNLIMKALELKPENRFSSAREMMAALKDSTIETPYRLSYRYRTMIPLRGQAVGVASFSVVTGSIVFSLISNYPHLLFTLPCWFGGLGLVSLVNGMIHRDIHIRIEEDGIIYTSRTEHFKAGWDEISGLRVRRETGLNFTLWGKVSVTPMKFEVSTGAGNFSFTPDLPHWQRLVDWIIFRSGLEPVQDVNEKGADQLFRREAAGD